MYQYVPTDSEYIRVCGRTKLQNPLPIFWTASGIEFQTKAGEVWVDLEAMYDHKEIWIQVEVDGFLIQRLLLPRGRQKLCLFREYPENHCKKIQVIQSAQPFQDDENRLLLIHGVEASQPLEILEKKTMNLEIIGDSLTSGEGLTGKPSLIGWSAGLFGINGHYGRRLAENLDADLRLVSQSGWGICSAWDNNPNNNIPAYYEKICGLLKGEKQLSYGATEDYDFSSWKADVIIINLGTNDAFGSMQEPWKDPQTGIEYKISAKDDGLLTEESSQRISQATVAFLKKVRSFNEAAHIIWTYGMCSHQIKDLLMDAVEKYVKDTQDKNVEFVLLPEMKPQQVGANNHPGALDHMDSSMILQEKIQIYMKNR